MKDCPKCKQHTKNLRCANTQCELYSQKVVSSSLDRGVKLHLLEIAEKEYWEHVPVKISQNLLDCFWEGEPNKMTTQIVDDGLTLEEIDIVDSAVESGNGWGRCEASGTIKLNGFVFDVDYQGHDGKDEYTIEMSQEEFERLRNS